MSSYPSGASRLRRFLKAETALAANRVIRIGGDGKANYAIWNSGGVMGVTNRECAGLNSGVSWDGPDTLCLMTSDAAIDSGDRLIVSPNTAHGLVTVYVHTGNTTMTGQMGHAGVPYAAILNFVGYAIEAASASGVTFLGYFSPRGL